MADKPANTRSTLYIRDMQRAKPRPQTELPQHNRPITRGDCVEGPRPCPFTSCRYHLFLDVTPAGSIKMHFAGEEEALAQMEETCALDVADKGGMGMDTIGKYFNVTGARIQQEVSEALKKMRVDCESKGIDIMDLLHVPEEPDEEEFLMPKEEKVL